MLRNWLRSLFSKKKSISGKPRKANFPAYFKPGLEELERRELLSATSYPGFSLSSSGNLYNTAISQTQPIDTGVKNFAVVNNIVYDLHTNNNFDCMNTNGLGKLVLDPATQSFAVDESGSEVELEQSGYLFRFAPGAESGDRIAVGVQSFAVDGAGDVVELQSGGNLFSFAPGADLGDCIAGPLATPSGQPTVDFAVDGAGDVVELQQNGWLYRYAPAAATAEARIAVGVQSFAVDGAGDVVELQSGGNLFRFAPGADAGDCIDLTTKSFLVDGAGDVVESDQAGVFGFAPGADLGQKINLGGLNVTQWTVNQPGYSGAIAATLDICSSDLTVTGLPSGVSYTLSGSSILFSGTPTTVGTSNFTVTWSISNQPWATVKETYSMTINPGPAASFAVSAPGLATVGSGFNVSVTAKDAYGYVATGYNGTAMLTASNGQSQSVLVTNGKGTVTFTPTKSGTITLTITAGAVSGVSGTITVSAAVVTPAPSGSGGVTPAPSSPVLNTDYRVYLAPDASQSANFVEGVYVQNESSSSIQITIITTFVADPPEGSPTQESNPPEAFIVAAEQTTEVTYFVNADQPKVQVQSAFFVDTSNSLTADLKESSTPSGAVFAIIAPGNTIAGSPSWATVTALDGNANVVTSYTGTVSFSSSDQHAGLPASYTFTAADQGSHTFTLKLDTAGNQTITATDSAGEISGQASVQVSPGAATGLTLGAPGTTMAGSAASITVTARDAYGNVATGYTGTVSFSSSDQKAGLPAKYTFTAADQGSHTFAVTLKTAGSQTIVAGDTKNALITGKVSVQVTPAAAKLLVKSQPASSVIAGSGFGVVIDAVDSQGNLATGFNGSVTLTLAGNPGGGTLGGTVTVSAVNGVATFSGLTLNRAGNGYSLKGSSGTLTAVTTTVLNVTAGTATHFVVTSQPPSSVTAGTGFGEVVKAEDAYGNVATAFNGSVTLSLGNNPGGSTLGGKLTVTAVKGVATFSGLTLNRTGAGYALNASSGSLIAATTAAVNVTAGTATHFVVTSQPASSVTAGAGFSVVVMAEDAYGNVATAFNGSVTLSLESNPGKSTLGGKLTVTAVKGVATFSGLTLNRAGNGYVLRAKSGDLAAAETVLFDVVN